MAKYKLIVVAGDEEVTREYDNVVNNLKEAEEKAEALRKEWCECYPDAYVACYPYNEDTKYPNADYRVWERDYYGDVYWKMMKVSELGTRMYTYLI